MKTVDFEELFDTQAALQDRMGWPTGVGERGLKENLLHAAVEIVEALQEINFKPWKAEKFAVNRAALATELTDILQFWANAALAMDFTATELSEALRAKWGVNHQRIDDGEVVETNKDGACDHQWASLNNKSVLECVLCGEQYESSDI